MATLRNVSSPFVVAGSDIDLELVLSNSVWQLATTVLSTLGIGSFKRAKTYRIALGNVELFVINANDIDAVTLALQSNLRTMRGWNDSTTASYMEWKQQLSALSGTDRKVAKAAVARMFGLNPIVYG